MVVSELNLLTMAFVVLNICRMMAFVQDLCLVQSAIHDFLNEGPKLDFESFLQILLGLWDQASRRDCHFLKRHLGWFYALSEIKGWLLDRHCAFANFGSRIFCRFFLELSLRSVPTHWRQINLLHPESRHLSDFWSFGLICFKPSIVRSLSGQSFSLNLIKGSQNWRLQPLLLHAWRLAFLIN